MVRDDAQRMILEIGGNVSKGVTKETNYLVVGEQDYKQYGDGFKSSKMKKAEKYLMNEQEIELITENQFLEMKGNEKRMRTSRDHDHASFVSTTDVAEPLGAIPQTPHATLKIRTRKYIKFSTNKV